MQNKRINPQHTWLDDDGHYTSEYYSFVTFYQHFIGQDSEHLTASVPLEMICRNKGETDIKGEPIFQFYTLYRHDIVWDGESGEFNSRWKSERGCDIGFPFEVTVSHIQFKGWLGLDPFECNKDMALSENWENNHLTGKYFNNQEGIPKQHKANLFYSGLLHGTNGDYVAYQDLLLWIEQMSLMNGKEVKPASAIGFFALVNFSSNSRKQKHSKELVFFTSKRFDGMESERIEAEQFSSYGLFAYQTKKLWLNAGFWDLLRVLYQRKNQKTFTTG